MIRISQASVTRPGDTDQYAAGDVIGAAVGDAMEFFTDQSGVIMGGLLIDNAAEATKPAADLMLFDEEPAVAADNAAFAPTDAQMEHCVGVISFAAADFKVGSGNGVIKGTGIDIPYFAPQRKLFGVLVARNTYTPVAAEKFTLRLSIMPE